MSETVATGILTGVLKVSGFFTSSVINSKAGKKFFSLLPGEVALASLDAFGMLLTSIFSCLFNKLSHSDFLPDYFVIFNLFYFILFDLRENM